LFSVIAVAGAAVFIWSPADPRIPPDEHLGILLFVFLVPLALVPAFARVRASLMALYRMHDAVPAVVLMAAVNFLVLLTCGLGLGAGFGMLHLSHLVLRAS